MKDSWENIELCNYEKKNSKEELFINEDIIENDYCEDEPLIMEDEIKMEKYNQQYEIIENKDINYYINIIKNKYVNNKKVNYLINKKKYELSLILIFSSFACSLYNLYSKYTILENKYNMLAIQLACMEKTIYN